MTDFAIDFELIIHLCTLHTKTLKIGGDNNLNSNNYLFDIMKIRTMEKLLNL